MSKFGAVILGGQSFWTYDVSLSIMLVETLWVGEELPVDQSLMGSAADYQLTRAVDLLRGVSLSDRQRSMQISAGRQ